MIYVVGGGNSLNFKVVGGTAAPASPKENTIWINTNTDVSSWDFSATEPYRRSKNKNMIVYPFYHTTRTENGVTFTDNKDGTVTVNGTATADTFFRVHYAKSEYVLELEPGTYTVSDVAGTSNGRLELLGSYDNQTTWSTLATCNNNGEATFTITQKAIVRASIKVYKGKTYNNLVFKPQIEKGSTATSFVKGDATGQVWISTGAASTAPFNALKKNNITVYPISAKQYVSGAWADKTAKIYQNGAWANWWDGELYENGNQFTSVTGGWAVHDYKTDSRTLMAAEHKSDQMFFQAENNYKVLMGIGNPVDLSDVNQIRVTGKINKVFPYNGTTYGLHMDVLKTKDLTSKVARQSMLVEQVFDYTLDVSNLTGEHYVIIWADSNANIQGYITGVYLN